MEVNGSWIKEQHKYKKTLKIFSSKKKFLNLPESIKNNSFEYNS